MLLSHFSRFRLCLLALLADLTDICVDQESSPPRAEHPRCSRRCSCSSHLVANLSHAAIAAAGIAPVAEISVNSTFITFVRSKPGNGMAVDAACNCSCKLKTISGRCRSAVLD